MEEEKKPDTSLEDNKKVKDEKKEYSSSNEPDNVKTNPVLIILLIVFFLSFIGGCVFTVKNLMNGNKNKNTNTQTNTEPTNEPDKIENLKEIDIKGYDEIIDKIDFARETKKDFEVSDLTNQQILRIGLSDNFTSNGYFSSSDLNKSIKSQLGDIEYTDEPIKCLVCGNSLYKYSEEEKIYEEAPSMDHGHGPAGSLYKQYYFVSSTKNETKGTLEIKYKILYGEFMDEGEYSSTNIYLSAEDASNKTNGIITTNMETGYEKADFDKAYEDNVDKIPVTTYLFVKDKEDNYVFKKVSVN